MNKKPFYAAPEAEFLDVWFEENLLTGSPDGTWDNSINPGTTWDSGEGDYGLE